jgi:hypothetical protein
MVRKHKKLIKCLYRNKAKYLKYKGHNSIKARRYKKRYQKCLRRLKKTRKSIKVMRKKSSFAKVGLVKLRLKMAFRKARKLKKRLMNSDGCVKSRKFMILRSGYFRVKRNIRKLQKKLKKLRVIAKIVKKKKCLE